MHIGIDLRCLPVVGEPGDGVAHATRELLRGLINVAPGAHQWTLFVPENSVGDKERHIFQECQGPSCRVVKLQTAAGGSLRQSLQRHPCELLFVPSGAAAPGLRVPLIPWVHDIAIFEHPEWFPQSLLKRTLTTNLFRKGVLKAPQVLAVSQFTKDELVRLFNLDPAKITVTWEGGDSVLGKLQGADLSAAKQQAKARLQARGVVHPFILCLGTLEPRKNIPIALTAWSQAKRSFRRPVDLVVAGRDGWKLNAIAKSLDAATTPVAHEGPRLHRIETPTDEHRRDLLLAADLVALPSLYEGFGLVALEGMQAQTAVAASNGGSLPEVLGSGGLILPPQEVGAWAAAFVDIMNDAEARKRLAQQGKEQSARMSWERSAKTVLEILTRAKI